MFNFFAQNLFLIVAFTAISFIVGLIVTFNSSNILNNKPFCENLALFCVASLIIFFVLLAFRWYSLNWSNSTHPSMLFTRIKAFAILALVLVISFIWLNWTTIKALILMKKEALIGGLVQFFYLFILIIVIIVFLTIGNQNEVDKQIKEIIDQRRKLRKNSDGSQDQKENNISESEKAEDIKNHPYEHTELKGSNIRPYSYLPPTIIPYGLRTVHNYPPASKINYNEADDTNNTIKADFNSTDNKVDNTSGKRDIQGSKPQPKQNYVKKETTPVEDDKNYWMDSLQSGAKGIFTFMRTQEEKKKIAIKQQIEKEKADEEERAKQREKEDMEKQKAKINAKAEKKTYGTGKGLGAKGIGSFAQKKDGQKPAYGQQYAQKKDGQKPAYGQQYAQKKDGQKPAFGKAAAQQATAIPQLTAQQNLMIQNVAVFQGNKPAAPAPRVAKPAAAPAPQAVQQAPPAPQAVQQAAPAPQNVQQAAPAGQIGAPQPDQNANNKPVGGFQRMAQNNAIGQNANGVGPQRKPFGNPSGNQARKPFGNPSGNQARKPFGNPSGNQAGAKNPFAGGSKAGTMKTGFGQKRGLGSLNQQEQVADYTTNNTIQ